MKAGDVAAMPADIRHRGFSPKRSMLLVWENASPELPQLYASGKMPPTPVPRGRRRPLTVARALAARACLPKGLRRRRAHERLWP